MHRMDFFQFGAERLTSTGMSWLAATRQKAVYNQTVLTESNGGRLMETLGGTPDLDPYQLVDVVLPEAGQKKSVVSLTTRSDNPGMSDQAYLRRVEWDLMEKSGALNDAEVIAPKPGRKYAGVPVITAAEIESRMCILGMPETRAHLIGGPELGSILERVRARYSLVYSTVLPVGKWRPLRGK